MTDLRAAVAAGALGSEESYRALLQSIGRRTSSSSRPSPARVPRS